jgi:hypothetical protein
MLSRRSNKLRLVCPGTGTGIGRCAGLGHQRRIAWWADHSQRPGFVQFYRQSLGRAGHDAPGTGFLWRPRQRHRYAIPAMIFGTFDARQFAVAVGVGALFGAFPDFLGGAGGAAFLRGALANEIQYVVSAVVCDDIQSLTPIGHLANIGVGGVIGWLTGPSVSPDFDRVWNKSVAREVYENMGGDMQINSYGRLLTKLCNRVKKSYGVLLVGRF